MSATAARARAEGAVLAEAPGAAALAGFVCAHRRLLVLTGAGCSTASGIPAYRDHAGRWAHPPPVQHRDFLERESVRRRYWARSLAGWARVAGARPNAAHLALADLEARGHVGHLVTQNVDGLHQRAGSRAVTELHGTLARVQCLDCGADHARADVQAAMLRDNPGWSDGEGPAPVRPDGDAAVAEERLAAFRAPACGACGGRLMPAVVFYGAAIPAPVSQRATAALAEADAVLVIGSSLMVFSGFRLVRAAAQAGKPVAAVNLGATRADDLLTLKLEADCARLLPRLQALLPAA